MKNLGTSFTTIAIKFKDANEGFDYFNIIPDHQLNDLIDHPKLGAFVQDVLSSLTEIGNLKIQRHEDPRRLTDQAGSAIFRGN